MADGHQFLLVKLEEKWFYLNSSNPNIELVPAGPDGLWKIQNEIVSFPSLSSRPSGGRVAIRAVEGTDGVVCDGSLETLRNIYIGQDRLTILPAIGLRSRTDRLSSQHHYILNKFSRSQTRTNSRVVWTCAVHIVESSIFPERSLKSPISLHLEINARSDTPSLSKSAAMKFKEVLEDRKSNRGRSFLSGFAAWSSRTGVSQV
jgi:hypothetical protein